MDIQAIQSIKQRFGIIGNHFGLNRAIDIARQVASTDLSVLVTGPSGSGKEIFPQIIHQYSSRTVSYTHLDVYKRQKHGCCTTKQKAILLNAQR